MVNIKSLNKEDCTGCYSCSNACQYEAIEFVMDDKGFHYPSINEEKCTDCGDCVTACPVMSPFSPQKENFPLTYAAWSNDDYIRKNSSSGGIFSEIASSIINNDGVVYGASFNEKFYLGHIPVSDLTSLEKIRGSKYIQSQINEVYNEIILLAKKEVPVLFCGTPCQVSALQKNVSLRGVQTHVYTCDLVCHGVASQHKFDSYISYLSQRYNSKITNYNFRDKTISWDKYGTKIEFKNGLKIFNEYTKDPFMLGYLRNYYLRPSCYRCKFAHIPRNSDITLGDYWGVPRHLYDPRGVSLLLINNEHGKRLIKDVDNIKKFKVDMRDIEIKNPRIIQGRLNIPKELSLFNKIYDQSGFQGVLYKFLMPTPKHLMMLSKIKGYISTKIKIYQNRI